jgi:hypothetical protein
MTTCAPPSPTGRPSRRPAGPGLNDILNAGDPLADAVVAEIHERGRKVRTALAAGISKGLASVSDPPPAVAALLTATETAPAATCNGTRTSTAR